jgi:MoxR-like ATPase
MMDGAAIEPRMNAAAARLEAARAAVSNVIIGQAEVVDLALVAILSGGHALLTGVPGLGKTRLVETLGLVLGLHTRRVQFTPDLMPSDILGSEVLDEGPEGRKFRFIPGPIFTELLMADEINRASPRTQSALLQAMAEGAVAVAGENRKVPTPFHVLATQNPIEQEGTYPLPEAQLDRFLLDIRIDYPEAADERAMLLATTGIAEKKPAAVMGPADLLDAQFLLRAMPVGSKVVDGIMFLGRNRRLGRN